MVVRRRLDPDVLRPSGTILTTQLRLAAEIEARVIGIDQSSTVLDLLVRLDLAPDRTERASRLCSQLNLSAAHMSRTIDRAEAAGLVERRPDPNDRRAQLIVLTPDGDAALAEFAPRLHHLLRTVIHDVLGRAELAALVASLERIQRACDDLAVADLKESTHA
jgi:DNA-binding MarR family transcriptional regulator